jgi:5-methylcytosine-specific restriction protein B
MGEPVGEIDLQLRRRRFAQLERAWEADPARRSVEQLWEQRTALSVDARQLVEAFIAGDRTVEELRDGIGAWSRGKPTFGFAGAAGSMFLNQLVKDGGAHGVGPLLRELLPPPTALADAVGRTDRLAAFVDELRAEGSAARAARSPYFLTWMWSLQDPVAWRPQWPSAEQSLLALAFLPATTETQGQRLAAYRAMLERLGDDPLVVEEVLSWWDPLTTSIGFDTTLPERCALAMQLPRDPSDERAGDDHHERWQANETNVRIGLTHLQHVAKRLAGALADVLGAPVASAVPSAFWVPASRRLRGDLWASWRPRVDGPAPAIRLHVARNGVFLVLNPEVNRNPKGYLQASFERLRELDLGDLRFFATTSFEGPDGGAFEPTTTEDRGNGYNLGLELDLAELATADGLTRVISDGARRLAPIVRELLNAPLAPSSSGGALDLSELAGRFTAELPYPDDAAEVHHRDQESWAAQLAPGHLAGLSKDTVRKIIAQRYGSPGPQSILNTVIRDADDQEWSRLLRSLDVLLWGDEPVEVRIDRVLDEADLGFRGLKETVVLKLLAIAQPERFLPVYPYSGDRGKAALLEHLGLPVPSLQASAGTRHVLANDALRAVTEPLLPGDPWGQKMFLYWLLEEADQAPPVDAGGVDVVRERLTESAARLYVDDEHLFDLYALLAERRQVVFYGPPGTGKTYFAQELATAIAPDPDRRMLIQFHPSSTYEDFFEGYRPEPTEAGGLTYRLVPGPLRLLADAAAADPDHTYVLVIDELNRANLPKVFGELLFLLEYRDRSVRLLYQPDVDFELPANLWMIGTMNTADRSVALVDAALRRRFQFVPFIPDVAGRSPIANVLRRWVEANGELESLPEIVDRVNNQLRVALGGDHLLLGPSYFMRPGIDEEALRRIWRYQIEPLIDDLFFGEPDKARSFRFDEVWQELGAPAEEVAEG